MDTNFFRFIAEKSISTEVFGKIEKRIGTIVIGEHIYEEIENQGKNFLPIYRSALFQFHQQYINFFTEISREDIGKSEEIMGEIYNEIKKPINYIFHPKTSFKDKADKEIVCLSILIKRYSGNPVIISDDRHFLIFINLIASYFGISFGIFSTFEVLRYIENFDAVKKYLQHKKIKQYLLRMDEINRLTKNPCESFNKCIEVLFKKGKLSVHPYGKKIKDIKRTKRLL